MSFKDNVTEEAPENIAAEVSHEEGQRDSFLWAAFYGAALMGAGDSNVRAAAEVADSSLREWLRRFADAPQQETPNGG